MKKNFFLLVAIILIASLLSGCVAYRDGVPGCSWGFLGLGGFVSQGEENPKHPGFICQDDGSFKKATVNNPGELAQAATVAPTAAPAQPTQAPAQPTMAPTAAPTAAPTQAQPEPTAAPAQPAVQTEWTPPQFGDIEKMPKNIIEMAPQGEWFHRVFNPRLFKAPAWDGADSWFVSLSIGPNSGGSWTSYGNSGEIVYRATENSVSWTLAIKTTAQYKEQFMGAGTMPAAVNIRILPETLVYVRTAGGQVVKQATSDLGDLTITLPDDGIVTIWTSFTTAAPTGESRIHWGPQDRTEGINILDAR